MLALCKIGGHLHGGLQPPQKFAKLLIFKKNRLILVGGIIFLAFYSGHFVSSGAHMPKIHIVQNYVGHLEL